EPRLRARAGGPHRVARRRRGDQPCRRPAANLAEGAGEAEAWLGRKTTAKSACNIVVVPRKRRPMWTAILIDKPGRIPTFCSRELARVLGIPRRRDGSPLSRGRQALEIETNNRIFIGLRDHRGRISAPRPLRRAGLRSPRPRPRGRG